MLMYIPEQFLLAFLFQPLEASFSHSSKDDFGYMNEIIQHRLNCVAL